MSNNRLIHKMFCAMPLSQACDLHTRLKDGQVDPETRRMLRSALARVTRAPQRMRAGQGY